MNTIAYKDIDNTLIIRSLMGWIVFLFLYSILKSFHSTEIYSAYFPLVGETGLDFLAFLATLLLWNRTKNGKERTVFLLLTISFISSTIADFIYNIVINLFHFEYENSLVVTLFDIPFALFLFFQVMAWAYIIYLNRNTSSYGKRFFYAPNVILPSLMFIMFTFGIPWKVGYFSVTGVFQSIDTILEVSGFALATICLARSKTQLVRYLTTGYLIIISSDFIIRYFVVSGMIPYLSPFESTWVFGLLLTCVGCYLSIKDKKIDLFQLLPVNSLQSQITIWSLILWLGSVLLFIGSSYLFSEHNGYGQITPGFISILVPFSVLSIIGSSILSTKISSTLYKLENIINEYVDSDTKCINSLKKQVVNITNSKLNRNEDYEIFGIYEVENLGKFIIKTINELQKANRAKAEFLMHMSHDFRTPASGIYHMSRTIHKRLEDPHLKNLQKLIVDSSEQLMTFFEDVLDYSRLDNDQYKSNNVSVDVESVINDVMLFVSAKVKEKNLTIRTKFPNQKIKYNGDRLMVHRIILNIVSNAIKFTHYGYILISISEKSLKNQKWMCIKVKDTGIGIDKAHHKQIFEPFTRVHSPESSKYPGIGLGLSNVYLMINKMGGQITIESNINDGAIFRIMLPI